MKNVLALQKLTSHGSDGDDTLNGPPSKISLALCSNSKDSLILC